MNEDIEKKLIERLKAAEKEIDRTRILNNALQVALQNTEHFNGADPQVIKHLYVRTIDAVTGAYKTALSVADMTKDSLRLRCAALEEENKKLSAALCDFTNVSFDDPRWPAIQAAAEAELTRRGYLEPARLQS